MRRPVRTVAVLLALGVLINVAAAWASAIWMPNPVGTTIRAVEGPGVTGGPTAWGAPMVSEEASRLGLWCAEESWALVVLEGQPDLLTLPAAAELRASEAVSVYALSETVVLTMQAFRAGVPMRSLGWRVMEWPSGIDPPPAYRAPVSRWGGGLMGFDSVVGDTIHARMGRRLPVMPVWPGFAVNTLFYSVVLGVVFVGIPALRRSVRRARGCCGACGYPVGESEVCSECGGPVRPRNGTIAGRAGC